ncbi:VOC family protein [Ornithinibacillus sp. L9]|uniref:VOC family protein n=1 Tax=Ornithinibacillus caprae TaxID=2678566 RepID=A0A6N8FHH3_9BACI|nr:VOC family protein [Ornithinibacillus caprae]MUK88895.1 VOC family protein [Ornithinibacillus caprae]
MKESLVRVGTTYLPVKDVQESTNWYIDHLGAILNYIDEEKAILDFANQSFFLVRAKNGENVNFYDAHGRQHFSCTFEVNGLEALEVLHEEFKVKGITVGEIENRGHTGRNFVFSDPNGNMFDVWSELSEEFKKRYGY